MYVLFHHHLTPQVKVISPKSYTFITPDILIPLPTPFIQLLIGISLPPCPSTFVTNTTLTIFASPLQLYLIDLTTPSPNDAIPKISHM